MRFFACLTFFVLALIPGCSISGQNPVAVQKKTPEFSLYVLSLPVVHGDLPAVDLTKFKKPAGEPLLTSRDVQYYQKDRHEIGLWYTAGKRIKDAGDLVGKSFAVFIDDKPIYIGAFWRSRYSLMLNGAWIDMDRFNADNPILPLWFTYLDEKKGSLTDNRADARILRSFHENGNLQQELVVRGRCTGMRNTMKRRASVIFTFTVDSVIKGDHKEKEIEFETYSDGEGGKLLRALEATGTPYGEMRGFNREKELTLKFEQIVDPGERPYSFWFRSVE